MKQTAISFPGRCLLLILCLYGRVVLAQNICNANGNLMIYTNYDGGVLNINVDQNIPNLLIGVVGYEATSVNLSGPFVANVAGVHYAGFNGSNNPCGAVSTGINGAPAGASTSTIFAPPASLANPNGYSMIICGYSCSNNTSQGGCNTVDQIEAYFAGYFPGSVLFAHRVQYNCWAGTYSVSSGGSCCPNPPLTPGVIAGDQTVCANAVLSPLTSSTAAAGSSGPLIYQWQSSVVSGSTGFVNILNSNSPTYAPPPVSQTTWFRRGAGTASNPFVYSNTATVSVPFTTVQYTTNSPLCSTKNLTMTANTPGAVSYTWGGPNGLNATVPNVVVIGAQASTSGIYTLTAVNNIGCTASATLQVVVDPSPNVMATGTSVCEGKPVALNAIGATNYLWTGPLSYTAAASSATLPIAYAGAAGAYTVIGSGANSCTASAVANLTVIPEPVVSILNSPNIVICQGAPVILIATGAQSYTWQGAISIGNGSATASPLTSTVVGVIGDAFGCVTGSMTSVAITVDVCTGISQAGAPENHVRVYPNPATHEFIVQSQLAVRLHLTDNLGRLIRVIELNGANAHRVQMTDLPAAVYYLASPDKSIRHKIIITN